MVICGSFRGETDESVYVWIRRFESEAQREFLRSKNCDVIQGYLVSRPLPAGEMAKFLAKRRA